jgi:NADH-quinone oxidoreductase subunit J
MLASILFYLFAGIAIVSAILLITRRNPVHSAGFLVTTLLATGGIFLQLHAEFLLVTQIILYAGGTTLLFLFVIYLFRLDLNFQQRKLSTQKWFALLIAVALGAQAGAVLWGSRSIPGQGLFVRGVAPPDTLHPNFKVLAQSLFSGYLLPFEMIGVLLLVAMVGVVVMTRKRTEPQ